MPIIRAVLPFALIVAGTALIFARHRAVRTLRSPTGSTAETAVPATRSGARQATPAEARSPARATEGSPAAVPGVAGSAENACGATPSRAEIMAFARALDPRELHRLRHQKTGDIVARDFGEFQAVSLAFEFQINESPPTEDSADRKALTEDLQRQHPAAFAENAGFNASWPIKIGDRSGALELRIDPHAYNGTDEDGQTHAYLFDVGFRAKIQLGSESHILQASVLRRGKSDGEYWILGSLAGCESVITDNYVAIAAQFPGEGDARVRLRDTQGNWNDLPLKEWRHHDSRNIELETTATKIFQCLTL